MKDNETIKFRPATELHYRPTCRQLILNSSFRSIFNHFEDIADTATYSIPPLLHRLKFGDVPFGVDRDVGVRRD